MFVNLEKITGFESNCEKIEVLDNCGRTFYFMPNPERKRITFNLPDGEFFFCCDFKFLPRPLRYVCPPLPPKEKNIEVVKDLKITVTNNPHKASFKNVTGEMVLDYSFLEKPIPARRFVMGHEVGHNYYFTEWKCDYYSAYTMLQEGYNPSQCYYANAFCLSERQSERKEQLFKLLCKVKSHE